MQLTTSSENPVDGILELQTRILEIIRDGQFHSSEELSRQLGVSRTAIWRQLHKLQSMGMQLTSMKGKGYLVPGGLELLEEDKILAHLTDTAKNQWLKLHIFQTVDSTNDVAKRRIYQYQNQLNIVSGTVIMAEHQQQGRGRRGKHWISPFASSIYLSIVWHFDCGSAVLDGLSLSIGVAVSRVFKRLGVRGVQLKWPNDVYVANRKVGGILVEVINNASGCVVVVGIGINVAMPSKFGETIDQEWTDLKSELSLPLSRNHLIALLLEHSFDVLVDYQQKGFAAYYSEWQALDALHGQYATVVNANQSTSGILLGVNSNGGLRMKLDSGHIVSFTGGELSFPSTNYLMTKLSSSDDQVH